MDRIQLIHWSEGEARHRVRELPKPLGLVDYKICALDDDWSGMCFAPRRGGRPTRAAGP